MFWGVTILGGRRYTQTVEKSYHISKAVLDVPVDGKVTGKRVQLMLEHNKSQYLLCNLDSEKSSQVDLDLIFTEGEEVTFYLNGEGAVHLSGYVLDFDEEDDEFYDDESEEEDVKPTKPIKREDLNQNSKRIKTEESSASFVATKKAKTNGSIEDDLDDEEDSDDALGNLDEEFDSADEEDDEEMDDEEDDDEEDDEEEDEEEDEPKQVKPAPKINGQAPKVQQQKGTPGQKGQQNGPGQKNTPGKPNNNTPGKPNNTPGKPNNTPGKPNNNQTPKGGQPNQNNKFGQNKGQNNSPLGQNKPNNNNQKGPQQQNQQKGGQNKFQQFNKQKGGSFTPDQKGAKTLPGGLQVNDVHVGSGPEAKKGKFVHVRYIGRLPNNKEFDRSTGKPFSFRLGAGQVIKGWEQGLEGMKVGGKRKIIVPPSLGYGNRSTGPIPANSTLHFDLELVSIS